MKWKTCLLSAALLLAAASPSQAADEARRQAVQQMLATMYIDQTLDQFQSQVLPAMTQQLNKQLDSDNCSPAPACTQKIKATFAKVQNLMTQYLSSPPLRQMMKQSMEDFYAENFTLEEIGQIDAFYRTPAGQKQLRLSPQAATLLMPKLMQDIQANLNPKMKALMDELKQ